MARHTIALVPPTPLPPLPTEPRPTPSPLQALITSTLQTSDYDALCVPLTNERWKERWSRLCLRPVDDDVPDGGGGNGNGDAAAEACREHERAVTDREADEWRRDGGLARDELNVSRLEESQAVVALASDWLELDAPDEGIRFDSELALRAEMAQAIYLALPTLVLPAPSLANRAFLPSYARAVANALQMSPGSAQTTISIRIPVSDPIELIGQGPAGPAGPANPAAPGAQAAGAGLGINGAPGQPAEAPANKHKRMSSLSTRPTSMHQNQLSLLLAQGAGVGAGAAAAQAGAAGQMRLASGASAISAVSSAPSVAAGGVRAAQAHGDPSSTWEMWDCIRSMCGYNPRLTVTLDLTNPLPPSVGALARWTAEPVKNVWLPAGSFISNAKGYPVLSKACQAFLRGMTRQNPAFILSDTHLGWHAKGGPAAYIQYVRHITSQQPLPSNISPVGPAEYTHGYGDYLQAPLQPLMDDLPSLTYDVFERDPVKYQQYEEAIVTALADLPTEDLVITVAGAGRGPLVDCVLRALARASRAAAVYAVEKNAAAFTTLQERQALEWGAERVTLVHGDMRTMDVPRQADLLVSELLGSFGDNELAPECLDGAVRFLKPTGISIPTSYTAYLAPVSSSKLHAEATAPSRPAGAAETPYVVMMQQANLLSGDGGGVAGRCGDRVQMCWTFEHPRRDLIVDAAGNPLTNVHNTRSASLTFSIPHAGQLHGLAGYFEAHLYGAVGLSTHPDTHARVSPDMFSWFPLYFPLAHPLYLPSGAELDVAIWRLADGKSRRVWYEWAAEAWLPTAAVAAPPTHTPHAQPGLLAPAAKGAPLMSPMMDAPYSPFVAHAADAHTNGRVKIGQTELHNAGGAKSWVGL
ncbi:hypothetical protein Q5752_001365 [Cryptotrichosporon argae]